MRKRLNAQAKSVGLTLEQWLSKLAANRGPTIQNDTSVEDCPIWEFIAHEMAEQPPEDLACLPEDGASQVDHYLYGVPKREA